VHGTATVRDGENVAIVDIRMPSGHDDHRLDAAEIHRVAAAFTEAGASGRPIAATGRVPTSRD
jgi:hypothetical protein